MKNLSTGTGLAILAGAIVAWPVLDRLMPNANAMGIGPTAVSAVAAAATAQGAPTIVWYGTSGFSGSAWNIGVILRSWSDGRVEMKRIYLSNNPCAVGSECNTAWFVVSDPSSGYSARFDGNSDDAIDGVDLGQMLAAWGPVTRNPVPPSDCPLNLINP